MPSRSPHTPPTRIQRAIGLELTRYAKLKTRESFVADEFPQLCTLANLRRTEGGTARDRVAAAVDEQIAQLSESTERDALRAIFPGARASDPGNLGARQRSAAKALGISHSTLRSRSAHGSSRFERLIDLLAEQVCCGGFPAPSTEKDVGPILPESAPSGPGSTNAIGTTHGDDPQGPPFKTRNSNKPHPTESPSPRLLPQHLAGIGGLVLVAVLAVVWAANSGKGESVASSTANTSTSLLGGLGGASTDASDDYRQAATALGISDEPLDVKCPYSYGEVSHSAAPAPTDVAASIAAAAANQGEECAPAPLFALGSFWGQPLGGTFGDPDRAVMVAHGSQVAQIVPYDLWGRFMFRYLESTNEFENVSSFRYQVSHDGSHQLLLFDGEMQPHGAIVGARETGPHYWMPPAIFDFWVERVDKNELTGFPLGMVQAGPAGVSQSFEFGTATQSDTGEVRWRPKPAAVPVVRLGESDDIVVSIPSAGDWLVTDGTRRWIPNPGVQQCFADLDEVVSNTPWWPTHIVDGERLSCSEAPDRVTDVNEFCGWNGLGWSMSARLADRSAQVAGFLVCIDGQGQAQLLTTPNDICRSTFGQASAARAEPHGARVSCT